MLDQLNPIIPPEAVTMWPELLPGWIVVIALLIVVLTLIALQVIRKHNKNQYRRDGLAELERRHGPLDLLHRRLAREREAHDPARSLLVESERAQRWADRPRVRLTGAAHAGVDALRLQVVLPDLRRGPG